MANYFFFAFSVIEATLCLLAHSCAELDACKEQTARWAECSKIQGLFVFKSVHYRPLSVIYLFFLDPNPLKIPM